MHWIITFDRLPKTACIDGVEYPIGYGYRYMMAAEIEMFNPSISDEQRLLNALNLFYLENIPPNIEKAVEFMLWFHRCGEEAKKGKGSKGKTKRGYCFRQDAPLIYAAFRQQYGIDLRKTKSDELHWWEFAAMFEALDENTKIAKVMYWRTCKTNGMSKEQKAFINKMRALYALDEPDQTMDTKTRLARRNADMQAYVRKRMEECRKG